MRVVAIVVFFGNQKDPFLEVTLFFLFFLQKIVWAITKLFYF